jgi:hypothetical protein
MIVVAVWVYTKPIVFSQDTLTYIHHARELQLRTTLPGALFSRTPGLPLVLLLFHVTDLKHSVFWLIVFHSVLAVATCWLFYLTARLIDRGSALIISLVFIATMLPFMNVKYIMTEQMFLFATMLSAYGLVSYLMARTTRDAKAGDHRAWAGRRRDDADAAARRLSPSCAFRPCGSACLAASVDRFDRGGCGLCRRMVHPGGRPENPVGCIQLRRQPG